MLCSSLASALLKLVSTAMQRARGWRRWGALLRSALLPPARRRCTPLSQKGVAVKRDESKRHVKLIVPLEQDEDGYPPVGAERLWALDLGEGRYQLALLRNVPLTRALQVKSPWIFRAGVVQSGARAKADFHSA
jgi:hypothetical protein